MANYGTDYVSVLLGNGDGSFQAPHNYVTGSDPRSVAVGDFNGDGNADLIVADSGSDDVRVLLGRGDGTFMLGSSFAAGSAPYSVVVGDFNGDGVLDLAVADSAFFNRGTPGLSVLLGNGDGTFLPAQPYFVGAAPTSLALGDFNGDGIADLAVAFQGGVRVLLGQSDGTFRQTNASYITRSDPWSVGVADFNGDGRPDLAVADINSNDVSIRLNDGVWSAPHPGGSPQRQPPQVKHHSLRPSLSHAIAGDVFRSIAERQVAHTPIQDIAVHRPSELSPVLASAQPRRTAPSTSFSAPLEYLPVLSQRAILVDLSQIDPAMSALLIPFDHGI